MYLFYCRDWRKRENSNPYFNLLAFLVRKRTLEKKINYTFPKNQAWGVKKIAFKNWLDNYPPPPQFRTKTIMNIQIFAVFICMMIPVFLSSNSDFQSFMVFIEFLPSVLSFPPPSTLSLGSPFHDLWLPWPPSQHAHPGAQATRTALSLQSAHLGWHWLFPSCIPHRLVALRANSGSIHQASYTCSKDTKETEMWCLPFENWLNLQPELATSDLGILSALTSLSLSVLTCKMGR